MVIPAVGKQRQEGQQLLATNLGNTIKPLNNQQKQLHAEPMLTAIQDCRMTPPLSLMMGFHEREVNILGSSLFPHF